jgi:signal transduction histidine kinase
MHACGAKCTLPPSPLSQPERLLLASALRSPKKQRFVNQADDAPTFPPEWNEILERAVHDIRNPLSSMLATLEILRHLTEGSDQAAKVIEMLDRQVMSVSDQLERLLRDPRSFKHPPL